MALTDESKLDGKKLDMILNRMLDTVVNSREQIFEIGEQSRKETDSLSSELDEIKEKVSKVIENHDQLVQQAKLSRSRLAEVSRRFEEFSEDDIRHAYEKANDVQIALSRVDYQEKQLKERRAEIERRLRGLKDTTEKAEALAGQVSVVLDYLNGDLKSLGELVADAEQKQAFGLKIIEAQEEERRRLSREIHDGPAQLLAQVLLGSEIVERVYKDKGPEASKEELSRYREMVRHALVDVRRIIYDLRPMSLDDLGLVPTLEKYLIRLGEQYSKITMTYRTIGEATRLQEKLEVALFRLVQEAVQNACKHSGCNQVRVVIEFRKKQIVLLIRDNGQGFDPEVTNEGSFGLIGMKERVEMLSGTLEIQSKLKQGTTIIVQIPIIKEEEE